MLVLCTARVSLLCPCVFVLVVRAAVDFFADGGTLRCHVTRQFSLPVRLGKLRSHCRRVSRVCVLIGGCALNAPTRTPTREFVAAARSRTLEAGELQSTTHGAVLSSSPTSSSTPTRVKHVSLRRSPTTAQVHKVLRPVGAPSLQILWAPNKHHDVVPKNT